MGNYHHHQNPSAFNLDLVVVSNICNLYNADGLYAIDSTQHSPLIGFAYDGFPIYGAYAYLDTNGTGGIVRMKSGYSLRNITVRNTDPSGQPVSAGPAVSTTYPLGYFREDYEYIPNSAPDYLDEHNGRFCVTPEYPNGIYCYFATVDQNWNSAYPYVIGPTFYGIPSAEKVTAINEPVTTYTPSSSGIAEQDLNNTPINIFLNPYSELIIIQLLNLNQEHLNISLFDVSGKLTKQTGLHQGSTIAYFDTQDLYEGIYIVRIDNGKQQITKKVNLIKN